MTAWLTTQGPISKSAYQSAIRLLARMCQSPIRFTVDAITAEDDRVVIEAHSEATLINGEQYANTYVFSLRVRDGRIAWIAEHFNALIATGAAVPAGCISAAVAAPNSIKVVAEKELPVRIEPGRVAVVTGGASGIGYALAAAAASRGLRVVLSDVRADALDAAAARASRVRRGGDDSGGGRVPASRHRPPRPGRLRPRLRPAGLLQRGDRGARPRLGADRGRLGPGDGRQLHGHGAPGPRVRAPAARGRPARPAAGHRVDGLGHRPARHQPVRRGEARAARPVRIAEPGAGRRRRRRRGDPAAARQGRHRA